MYHKTLKSEMFMKFPQLCNSKITKTAISNKKSEKKVNYSYIRQTNILQNTDYKNKLPVYFLQILFWPVREQSSPLLAIR